MESKRRARVRQAAILTLLVIGMALSMAITLGGTAFVLSAITLPLPLVVLWLSSDVFRADEQRIQSPS